MKAAAAAEEEEGRAEKAVTLQPAQNPELQRAGCSAAAAAAAAALSVWPACPVGVCSRTDERTARRCPRAAGDVRAQGN